MYTKSELVVVVLSSSTTSSGEVRQEQCHAPSAVLQYVLGRHVNFMSARWRSMSLPGKFHGGGGKIAAHPPGGREDCTRLPMTLLLIHQYGYSLGSVGNLDRFHEDGLHIHFLG